MNSYKFIGVIRDTSDYTLSRGRIVGRNWDKSHKSSSLLFTVTSTNLFYPFHPLEQKWLKLVCNVNIVHGNLKSEKSQDYT